MNQMICDIVAQNYNMYYYNNSYQMDNNFHCNMFRYILLVV